MSIQKILCLSAFVAIVAIGCSTPAKAGDCDDAMNANLKQLQTKLDAIPDTAGTPEAIDDGLCRIAKVLGDFWPEQLEVSRRLKNSCEIKRACDDQCMQDQIKEYRNQVASYCGARSGFT